jgi:septum formation protein
MKSGFEFSKQLILASASPRRKELLSSLIRDFEIIPADIDESAFCSLKPAETVKRLSYEKAKAVAAKEFAAGKTVLAADTVVVLKGKIYGKPCSAENAQAMLADLSGKRHTVFTGVTLMFGNGFVTFVGRSSVKFKKLSNGDILKYIEECKPFDKAGSYGIQDKQIVKSYRGSYSNIVGLPLEKLKKALTKAGVYNG